MSERSESGRPTSHEPTSERGPSAPAPKAPRAGMMSERSESGRPLSERSSADGRGRTTQLRLLQSERPRPLRARKTAPRARRAVHWEGQWRLDARTRQVGRDGVASARAALARADELREAS